MVTFLFEFYKNGGSGFLHNFFPLLPYLRYGFCGCRLVYHPRTVDIHICFFHQVDDEKTVGAEAFARIAPACAAVADIITVHNLFDALTASTGHRLHFLVYDKYIRSLDK